MTKKTFNLCIALDKNSEINEDLVISNSLYKLDEYIKNNFSNHRDVRKKYDDIISEFCLTYKDRIIEENMRNKDNRTGYIVILEKDYDENNRLITVRRIKVIYQNQELLSRSGCIKKIKKELNNDIKLKILRDNKAYLLSKNERDLIGLYFKYHNDKYKVNAINFLTDRIREEKSFMAYYDCRLLTNLCNLIRSKINIKKGKVTNISKEIPKKINLEPSKYHGEIKDEESVLQTDYFDTLIEQGNDEELYNLYSLEEIEKKEGRRNV